MNKRRGKKRTNRNSQKRKTRSNTRAESNQDRTQFLAPVLICVGLAIALIVFYVVREPNTVETVTDAKTDDVPVQEVKVENGKLEQEKLLSRRNAPEYALFKAPAYARSHSFNNETVLVWGGDHQLAGGLNKNPQLSNIGRSDYAGSDSCKNCHTENHAKWAQHSHRWMNVLANEESVKGDFSGSDSANIEYRGGRGEFYQSNGRYMMKLSRDGVEREFQINRTLGSRVHQYYIGVMVKGPEPQDHVLRAKDHVLPFGFELTLKEWVPIVHAKGQEGPDIARDDPFEIPSRLPYDESCSICHTTPPAGNLMLAMFKRFAAYTPRKLHFEGSNYIDLHEPGSVQLNLKPGEHFTPENLKDHLNDLANQSHQLLTPENAVNLGIACEACHLGAKAHVENPQVMPLFFPSGPHVYASGESYQEIWGKTNANKNFICARCHSGDRPQFAAGMATWNSTEYTDAMRGHCYHEQKAEPLGMESLTCVACHNPHEAIGRRWTRTPQQDNESCLKCHDQFRDANALQQHTHHSIGSTGGDCMNCHMPKINEGLGDLVRTHTIFSPTNIKMLEANQPNACNMCHVEESIDWTLDHLREWYGLSNSKNTRRRGAYSETMIDQNYSNRKESAALGWLSSKHTGTRMVGSDVLIKAKADWALIDLLKMLDDPYMEIRQFTVQRLRDFFDINTDEYGYKLYMTKPERQDSINKMIAEFEKKQDP